MNEQRIKFLVGTRIWLVPAALVSDAFKAAVDKLNNMKPGEVVDWTDQENKSFKEVQENFYVDIY